ncbi:hypothetical protein [Saccharolobus caldissimus]|nr:hypothetical protein [Saccharolobus caldissimus]
MNAQIQFGENWVKVKESVFYLTQPALEILKAWYNINRDKKDIEIEIEYIAKVFEILKPGAKKEAYNDLYTLVECRYFEKDRIEKLINKIYEKCEEKKANSTVREL